MTKHYEGVRALDGADLTVRAGELHALLGENGAGKSTLVKVLAGAVAPDGGTIRIQGEEVTITSRSDASALGIGIVFQHAELIDELTVAENVTLGRERSSLGFVNARSARSRTRAALDRLRAPLDPDRPVAGLRAGERQLVEIARALAFDARLLILDEPTASLGANEAVALFATLRELRAGGIALIYISHRLPEIFELSDRVTVMRDGRTIGTFDTADTDPDALVERMVGRDLSAMQRRPPRRGSRVVLAARDLRATNGLTGVSLEIHDGEVLGVYGLLGSGRTELARVLTGADRLLSGSIELDGADAKLRSPSQSTRLGMGLVPEDRMRDGTFSALSVLENLTATRSERLAVHGWIRKREQRLRAGQVAERLSIVTRSLDAPVSTLSGGNQQKVVFGRWLLGELRVLVLDDPTVGVDVGAKREIYEIIDDLAAHGTAVLLLSSELPELLALADRLLVLREGRTAGHLEGDAMTETAALRMALGQAA